MTDTGKRMADEDHGSLRADMRAAFRSIDRLVNEVRDMREMQVQAVAEQARTVARLEHLAERLGTTEQLAMRVHTLEHREAQRSESEREARTRGDDDRKARQGMLYSVVGSVVVSVVSFLGMLAVAGWAVVSKSG